MRRTVLPALTSIFIVVAWAAPAVAGDAAVNPLPAPGALGLVALAVIGAILLVRRK
ncbi:MAG: hypothetical protein O7I42_08285 [Alphaproteobacteria bacterium]|nr:hypothetical protein [Alphaproteobacteria bacterium]